MGTEGQSSTGRWSAGHVVGKHRLISPLGDARLSEVWLVEHVQTGERSSLRRLKLELAGLPRVPERFLAEANVLSAIRHPVLPAVECIIDEGGERYCTQELVVGQLLSDKLGEGRLEWAQSLEGAAGLAAALSQLHTVGIAHRGVHPRNVVLVEGSGVRAMKLLGFGGARLPGPGIDEPPVSSPASARYVAPEEKAGEAPDTRSDVWSFGRLLRELVPPGREVSVSVEELIQCCLAQEPSDRPRDMSAVARALVDALEESGVVYEQTETGGLSAVARSRIPETSQENPLAPSSFPRRFGTYHLLGSLGRGGMGDVCLARTMGPAGIQRICVIKQIRVDKSGDEEYVRRFVDEARVMAQLNHTNICHVLEVGSISDTYYLAMEHIHGVPLSHLMGARREQLPRPIALHVAAEILEGLDYAHRHRDPLSGEPMPVVHRDISPQNVMVNFEGEVKLIDFGLASSETQGDVTAPDVIIGKVAYMAPEQARGEAVDRRADQYAAAIVATELLLGERFYGDMPSHAIWGMAAQGGHLPPRFAELPSDVAPVLRRALAPDPRDRFEDCRSFKATLREAAWGDAPVDGRVVLRSFMQESCADEIQSSFQRIQNALRAVPNAVDEPALPEATPFTSRAPAPLTSDLLAAPRRPLALAAGAAALLLLAGAGAWVTMGPERPEEVAPQEPEPPPLLHITVVSEPPGATVLRGDERSPVGLTPLTLKLPMADEGVERFLVEREGYETTRFEAQLDRDQEIRVQLRPRVPADAAKSPPPESVTTAKPAPKPPKRAKRKKEVPQKSQDRVKKRQKRLERNSLAEPW